MLQDVLDKADTTHKLTKLNVDDVNILKPDGLVNVVHSAKLEVCKYRAKSGSASHINLFYVCINVWPRVH